MSEPAPITNLKELYQALERHDWFHEMSDDHSVWQRGCADWSRIKCAATKIDGGPALCDAWSKHKYSGEPWKTLKAPKPEPPL